MDVVAHPGAVLRVVVGAEHGDAAAQAERGVAGDGDEMLRAASALAGAPVRVRAGDVEIAQRDMAHAVRGGGVAQHPFGGEFGGAVGVDGGRRRILVHRDGAGDSVHRRGRGEDEPPHVGGGAGVEQVRRRGGVVAPVAQRVAHRFRHAGARREVDDRADPAFGEEAADERRIPGVAGDERGAVRNRLRAPRRQVVEDDDRVAGAAQGEDDVGADISGAAGDQHRRAGAGRHARTGRPGAGGGARGSRTPDLLNAIQALSQLSYGPTCAAACAGRGCDATPARAGGQADSARARYGPAVGTERGRRA